MLRRSTNGLLATARRSARAGHWADAAVRYARYLERRPGDAAVQVQYGHALKESGDWLRAIDAYARALDLNPDVADTWWHLGQLRKRSGDRDAAILCCRRVIALDPDYLIAVDELAELSRDAGASSFAGIECRDEPLRPGIYPVNDYDCYRHQIRITAPPRYSAIGPVAVFIDARSAIPADVRATLSSILDQTEPSWHAVVFASATIRSHSVASLEALDSRVTFVDGTTAFPDAETMPVTLLVPAGTVLDRQAVAWFTYAVQRTGCISAYCDHDQSIDHWRRGRIFEHPTLQPAYDPDWFADPSIGPAALLIDRSKMQLAGWDRTFGDLLSQAAVKGGIAHLPLLLASIKEMGRLAQFAPADPQGEVGMTPTVPPAHLSPATLTEKRIQIILQTRDEPAMLRIAVDSIVAKAARPALLDITVVDNRSTLHATRVLLTRWEKSGRAHTLRLDEAFNWSHANNLAAAQGDAPLLLFLNNDTEMLTANWDNLLREILAPSDVGAMGALLLYPDRTIQHAGIVLGMGSGGPIHEGVGKPAEAGGPAGRWQRTRAVAAVTGAFLAMRREVFEEINGFDAVGLAIAFNDIDLCLRVRATGRRVVYAPGICVIHHESKSRGANVARSRVAWDLEELGSLHRRWGETLFEDPGYNLNWTTTGEPFLGYRFPSLREILRHIDRSARIRPWLINPAEEEPTWW